MMLLEVNVDSQTWSYSVSLLRWQVFESNEFGNSTIARLATEVLTAVSLWTVVPKGAVSSQGQRAYEVDLSLDFQGSDNIHRQTSVCCHVSLMEEETGDRKGEINAGLLIFALAKSTVHRPTRCRNLTQNINIHRFLLQRTRSPTPAAVRVENVTKMGVDRLLSWRCTKHDSGAALGRKLALLFRDRMAVATPRDCTNFSQLS